MGEGREWPVCRCMGVIYTHTVPSALPKSSAGTMRITFTNYQTNTDLSDEFLAARESR